MQEAKPQDGTTVKGYRALTLGDIERMNRLKDASRHFINLLSTESEILRDWKNSTMMESAVQAAEIDAALASITLAKTKIQEGCMWACRAIARPDNDC